MYSRDDLSLWLKLNRRKDIATNLRNVGSTSKRCHRCLTARDNNVAAMTVDFISKFLYPLVAISSEGSAIEEGFNVVAWGLDLDYVCQIDIRANQASSVQALLKYVTCGANEGFQLSVFVCARSFPNDCYLGILRPKAWNVTARFVKKESHSVSLPPMFLVSLSTASMKWFL